MKSWIRLLVCGCLVLGADVSATGNDPSEERAVMAALQTMVQATVDKNVATLTKIYHDDLMYSHSSGRTQTKAEVLKDAQGPGVVESITFTHPTIRIYGSVALVKMDVHHRSGSVGKINDNYLHVLWVLVKTSEGWQVTARHPSRLPEPRA